MPVWELERHKSGSPLVLINAGPHLKQPHRFQTTDGPQDAGAEQGQRSLVLAITAHVAMV